MSTVTEHAGVCQIKILSKREAEQKKIEDTLKQIGKTSSGSDLMWFQDLPIFADIPILEENKFVDLDCGSC